MRKRTLKEVRAFETANHAKKADRRPEERLGVRKPKKKNNVFLDVVLKWIAGSFLGLFSKIWPSRGRC